MKLKLQRSVMFEELSNDLRKRMESSSQSAKSEISGIRAGRASPGMLDSIKVEAYGQKMSINQIGNITTPDPRTINVEVWDASNVSLVDKSLRESNLGINPIIEGNLIRLPLPQLTEERRDEFLKVIGKIVESAKVAIRNIRRDGIEKVKSSEKEKELSQDESKRFQNDIDNMTSEFIKIIDDAHKQKEEDLKKI